MRTVIAKLWDKEKMTWDAISGIFLGWGYDIVETQDNVAQFSVAIIETENGKVVTTTPDNVTFVEKFEREKA